MKTTLRILIFAAALAMAAVPVTAGNPDWPNGPDEDPRLETPDDLGSGRWYLYSYIPDENVDSIRPEEADLGSGIHADAAWQVTTGTPEVVIAVLDSGINWDEIDLINKIYLNAGELPIPEGAAGYDANEDGVFNMRDYTGDSRIDDANGNGRIDAGDLIRIFSDETDGDGNGYVDDIAGWDFYRHDNDPADDTRYGHGTGEAKQAAAETNNGHGGPGVCPECLILPVRVGDSFVAEANRFAQGVVFAADSGVGVILEALGAINNTDFARDAVAYALSRGISFAASAADENSFHHNYPANYNGTIYTNNVVYDTMERDAATSFMALDTCTNWGPKVTVSAASNNCSSGATGHIGGALGLIHSYGVELGLDPPLSPAEVMGLVTMSASDVYNPEGEDNERVYPSLPGWDKYFGHGRLNLRAALDLIADGMIPPEALVESPRWFEPIHADTAVTVTGRVDAPRSASYDYRLYAQWGLTPDDGERVLIGSASDRTTATDGVLGVLSPSDLPAAKAVNNDPTADNAVLLTLEVENDLGARVLYYHQFFWMVDDGARDDFPRYLDGSMESSPVMADLDGDGAFELIVATDAGEVHAFRGDGSEMPGWPVRTAHVEGQEPAGAYRGSAAYAVHGLDPDRTQSVLGAIAAADLDGDGTMEIAAAAFNGALHVWEPDGSERPGFPVWPDPANLDSARVDYGFVGSPVLFDLDGDDALEIIAGAMDQRVYVWREDGTPQPGWPVLCRDAGREARIVSSPAIGDLDGDGTIELIVTTGERHGDEGRIYALYPDGDAHVGGAYLPGWPISAWSLMLDYLPFVGEGIVTSPVVADFDGDGADEIALNAGISLPTIWDGDGTVWRIMSPLAGGAFTDTEEFLMGALGGNYAIAAPNANGRLALVTGGVGLMFGLQQIVPGYRIPNDNLLGLWWANTGSRPNAWPRIMEDMQMISGHAVADINGDGLPEIISGSGGHYVHAYNIDGHEPTGWPKFTGGWIAATPAVGDMDGDGYLEVAVGTREGHLFVWNTTGRADGEIQWSSYAHDPRNTGNWATPLPAQNGPPPDTDDDDADDDIDDDSGDDDTSSDDDAGDDDADDDAVSDDDIDDDTEVPPAGDESSSGSDGGSCGC